MPLNLQNDENTTGGYIKYMASTGTWMKSEKMPDGNFGDVEFKFHQAVFDLANIQTGWGLLQKGQAPEWVMDESISKRALKPTDGREWKRGFKVSIFSQQMFEGVVEWSANGAGANDGIGQLYRAYEKKWEELAFSDNGDSCSASAAEGKLPLVQFDGALAVRKGMGSTNVPKFSIVEMVDAPAELSQQGELAVEVGTTEQDEFPE